MQINIKGIFEGLKNSYFPREEVKELISTVHKERIKICRGCEFNSKVAGKSGVERCLDCGCTLSLKTRCLSCSCPLKEPKWTAIISKEEDEQFKAKLNENNS